MDANPAPAAHAPEPGKINTQTVITERKMNWKNASFFLFANAATSNTDSGAESQENDTEAENDEEDTVAMTPRGASTWGRAHRVVDSQSQDRLFGKYNRF